MVSTRRVCISYKNRLNFSLSYFFDAVPLVTIFLIPTHLSFRRTLLGQVEEDTSTPKKDSPKKMKAKLFTTKKKDSLKKRANKEKFGSRLVVATSGLTSKGQKIKNLVPAFKPMMVYYIISVFILFSHDRKSRSKHTWFQRK